MFSKFLILKFKKYIYLMKINIISKYKFNNVSVSHAIINYSNIKILIKSFYKNILIK